MNRTEKLRRRTLRALATVLCAAFAIQTNTAQASEHFAFYTLFSDQAQGLSGDGTTAVGGYPPFRWRPAADPSLVKEPLGTEFRSGFAKGASHDGSVVVGYVVDDVFRNRGFRWTETGGYQLFDEPGLLGMPEDVSDDGSVVVGSVNNEGPSGEAFRWSEATGGQRLGYLPDPSAPNEWRYSVAIGVSGDGQVIVGSSSVAVGEREAVRWIDGQIQSLGDLPGGNINAIAWGTSADGSVIVGHGESQRGHEAFLWTESGGMESLWPLTGAYDVSADGSVVIGRGRWNGNEFEALVWDRVNGARSLYQILTEHVPEAAGWHLGGFESISDDGRVFVGQGNAPGGGPNYSLMVVVPEPSSFMSALAAAFVSFATLSAKRVRRGVRC